MENGQPATGAGGSPPDQDDSVGVRASPLARGRCIAAVYQMRPCSDAGRGGFDDRPVV